MPTSSKLGWSQIATNPEFVMFQTLSDHLFFILFCFLLWIYFEVFFLQTQILSLLESIGSYPFRLCYSFSSFRHLLYVFDFLSYICKNESRFSPSSANFATMFLIEARLLLLSLEASLVR